MNAHMAQPVDALFKASACAAPKNESFSSQIENFDEWVLMKDFDSESQNSQS